MKIDEKDFDYIKSVDNVNNMLKPLDSNDYNVDNSVDNYYFFKNNLSINESNLMNLPFLNLSRKQINKIERKWTRDDGSLAKVTVRGHEDYGVPKIEDFDVILALFRIHLNNLGKKIKLEDKRINIPKQIHFTMYELAKELDINTGGANYRKLDERLNRLMNTSIEAESIAFKVDANGNQVLQKKTAFGIIDEYNSINKAYFEINDMEYDITKIKDYQYVSLSDYIINNVCGNLFKYYDEKIYKKIKTAYGKRLYMIFNNWGLKSERFTTYDVLINYIGVSEEEIINNKSEIIRKIKNGLTELKNVKYIESYELLKGKGVNVVKDNQHKRNSTQLNSYDSSGELFAWFRGLSENGNPIFDFIEISDILSKNDIGYLKGFARYIDWTLNRNSNIKKLREYILNGLNYDDILNRKYNVEKFMD